MILSVSTSLLYAFYSFALYFFTMYPLEKAFKNHEQSTFRKEWLTDCAFFLGQYFLWGAVIEFGLSTFDNNTYYLLHSLKSFREAVATQPLWLQILEVIFLCDISIYWGHRLSHKIPWLWRFHRVHHTSVKLDWVAAFREHPVDGFYTRLIENLPAILMGFPLEVLIGFMVLRGMWGLLIHSNARISVGPLKYLLGSPLLHHWHHDIKRNGSCNFANLMPLMDIIFGTYYHPKDYPKEYGIPEKIPHGYWQQILMPFYSRFKD